MNRFQGTVRSVLATLLASGALAGCSDTVGGERGEGGGGGGPTGEAAAPESLREVDLLLVIDGSGSMADKQAFLADSIRPFLERLRDPRCVDAARTPVTPQPAPGAACPAGSAREYAPDVTVQLGVVSSSLSAGMLCTGNQGGRFNDDQAHLLTRAPDGETLPSYRDLGVFAWDPAQRLAPAGEGDFAAFSANVELAIRGVAEVGCGYEAPLEAMYRFLAEPAPMNAVLGGALVLDEVLLAQRAAFLRPQSALSVILLSDENDCSIREELRPFVGDSVNPMPFPRAECALDPADPCCASCIEATPSGCSGDGGCAAPGDPSNPGNFQPRASSDPNLHCWDSKRRFGLDFLYGVDRFVAALSSPTLAQADGSEVPNPVFAGGRSPSQVLYTAIVGVPWQDVARDPADITSGFQSSAELVERGTWDVILGDPASWQPPTDPLMVESDVPRAGPIPSTGESLPGPNGVNGEERDTGGRDLQYACIFDLPPDLHRICEVGDSCECFEGQSNPLLCSPTNETELVRARAYPGLRQLDVARQLAAQGRVVSLCGPLLAEGAPDPGTLGTIGISIGLGQVADQMAQLAPPSSE